MSSRKISPWDKPIMIEFIQDIAVNGDDHCIDVVLRCHHDKNSPTKFAWSLDWASQDGKSHHLESIFLDRLIERAVTMEMDAREANEREWETEAICLKS